MAAAGGQRAGMPPIRPSQTAEQLAASPAGEPVQVAVEAVTANPGLVTGVLLEILTGLATVTEPPAGDAEEAT